MNEERMKILDMLSQGKISSEEADKLLLATETQTKQMDLETKTSAFNDKFLYVNVEPKEGKKSERVFVKVPFALLQAGLNIAGLIPKEAQTKINDTMQEKGMSFDFSDLKPENIKEIMTSLEQFTVDVDSEDYTVKVFCK